MTETYIKSKKIIFASALLLSVYGCSAPQSSSVSTQISPDTVEEKNEDNSGIIVLNSVRSLSSDENAETECSYTFQGKKNKFNNGEIQEAESVETGKDTIANMTVGESLIEIGLEPDTSVSITKEKDGDKIKVKVLLSKGAVDISMRENTKISSVSVSAGKTEASQTKGVMRAEHGENVKIQSLKNSIETLTERFFTVEDGNEAVIQDKTEDNDNPEQKETDISSLPAAGLIHLSEIGVYGVSIPDERLSEILSLLNQ